MHSQHFEYILSVTWTHQNLKNSTLCFYGWSQWVVSYKNQMCRIMAIKGMPKRQVKKNMVLHGRLLNLPTRDLKRRVKFAILDISHLLCRTNEDELYLKSTFVALCIREWQAPTARCLNGFHSRGCQGGRVSWMLACYRTVFVLLIQPTFWLVYLYVDA